MRATRPDGRRRPYLDIDGYFATVEEQAAGDVLDGGGVEPVACEGGLGDGQAGRAHGA